MEKLTFDEMIAEQTEQETFLETVLSNVLSTTPIEVQTSISESALLECDENGVFPDDEEDDRIERELGV